MSDPTDLFSLVALDMNGTTVDDNGAFDSALLTALNAVGAPLPEPGKLAPLRGMAKAEMFERLVPDATAARRANDEFTVAFMASVEQGRIQPVDGAADLLVQLHDLGLITCLMTGFPLRIQQAIIRSLGWRALIDLSVSSDEVPRGRPHPDMIHHAAEGASLDDIARVVVVGDTVSDLQAGERAGAGLLVGVLGGAHTADQLRAVSSARLIAQVGDLPELLATVTRPPEGVSESSVHRQRRGVN